MNRIILNIGDIVVQAEPSLLETVLGSCVSICLWDESAKVGGMNHYLVPYAMAGLNNPFYAGRESIEKLVESLIRAGGTAPRTRAKVFGGGKVIEGLGQDLDVGRENIGVAREMLKNYGIPIVKELARPNHAIKVVFYTATGRAFVKAIQKAQGQ